MNATLTVSVVVAVIGSLGLVVVAKIRKPVTMQELFIENRELRREVKDQGDRINLIEERFEARDLERQRTITLLGAGFDVLWHVFERLRDLGEVTTNLSSSEQDTVDRARALRTGPITDAT